jgi:NAD(P)-dependent dehydrogenase (short-subunit alcohol dehydrogenase family)
VVVTGGGGGIGGATCRRFAEEGAKVAVFDMNLDAAQKVATGIREGAAAWRKAFKCDITDRAAVDAAVAAAESELGPIDVLVNNAGWDVFKPFTKTVPAEWDKLIAINLTGALHMLHAVLPGMAERKAGRIVNIASDAARGGSSGEAVYSACKGGLVALSKTLAREHARQASPSTWSAPARPTPRCWLAYRRRARPRQADRGLPQRHPAGPPGPARRPGQRHRLLRQRRRWLHHRPGHQRLRRPDHARLIHAFNEHPRTPMNFEDILYEVRNGVAWITINRPDKMNAFRGTTCDEIIKALNKAGYDREVGCIVLAGAGEKAFCTGGDQSAHDGNYDGRGTIGLPMEELHTAIRDVPKPVIARVQGFAIGGGNVLCTICDLTICSEKAIFGQVGPKMGSVDPGYGTAFLARVVGEKKAREIWYLNKRYSGAGSGGHGPGQHLRAARAARRDGAGVGRDDLRAQPDRHRDRQAQLQHGHRAPERHRRHGHVRAQAVLRHRRVARRA